MSNAIADPLAAHLKRKVRIVAGESGPHATQLFIEASASQKLWTPAEWVRVLAKLDACDLSVAAWRAEQQLAVDPLLS